MVGTIPEDKYYVTVEEVIDWLGLRRYYGGTIPTSVENRVKMYIEFAMGKVDRLTATTWNGRRKICYEWHDITKYKGGWWFGVGVPIFLTKMDLDPNIGKDGVLVLEVFNGVQYDNWAEKFEPRRMTGYWWVDPQEGIVFINTFVFWQGGKEIRVKYVYGRDDLPNTIKELTLLYVARDLLATERLAVTVPTGGQTLDFGGMINYIDRRIRELENMHMAVHIATMGKVLEEVEYDPETGEIITVGKDTSN